MIPHVTDDRGLGHKKHANRYRRRPILSTNQHTHQSTDRPQYTIQNSTTTTPNFTINPTSVIRTGFTRPEFKHFQETLKLTPLSLYAK
jgi:hypothetical protein